MGHSKRERIENAVEREKNYRKPKEQLKHLDEMGFAAEKERKKLLDKINKEKNSGAKDESKRKEKVSKTK